MAGIASAELITDLEAAASGGSPERRVLMLRRVTNLFLSSADRLNEYQIDLFDNVMVRLMQRIDAQSLAPFSSTFADLTLAPKQAVHYLACHEEIAVAASVLIRSRSLSDPDLVAIANKLGRRHLVAIASRRMLDQGLTDVLFRRGDIDVRRALAKNAGARFSESGYAALVSVAAHNQDIPTGQATSDHSGISGKLLSRRHFDGRPVWTELARHRVQISGDVGARGRK